MRRIIPRKKYDKLNSSTRISVLISLILGLVVISLSWSYRNSDFGMRLVSLVGSISVLLFFLFLIYSFIAIILSIWKRELPIKGISAAFVIYFGLLIWATSFQPLLVEKLSENWDFRLAALGLAISVLGLSFIRRN